MMAPDPRPAKRQAEIAELDAISRQRPLTDTETRRLQAMLYRDRYYWLRVRQREARAA